LCRSLADMSEVREEEMRDRASTGHPWGPEWPPSSAPREADVRDGGRADELDAFVAVRAAVEVVEEPLAAAEQDGHDHQVHLVDQAGAEVLLDLGDATAEPDVVSTSSPERPLERRLDALVDKVERRPALHRDGRTCVVGEHEHRVVIRRVGPPPATPLVSA